MKQLASFSLVRFGQNICVFYLNRCKKPKEHTKRLPLKRTKMIFFWLHNYRFSTSRHATVDVVFYFLFYLLFATPPGRWRKEESTVVPKQNTFSQNKNLKASAIQTKHGIWIELPSRHVFTTMEVNIDGYNLLCCELLLS